jgi:hypothetical protein
MVGFGILVFVCSYLLQNYLLFSYPQGVALRLPIWAYLLNDIAAAAWFLGAFLFIAGLATIVVFSIHKSKADRLASGRR